MKNIFWLLPNQLAGRPGPSYAPWRLEELRAAGFSAVLNVSEFEPMWLAFEAAGIDVVWIPLPNHYPATPETEERCLELLPQAYRFVKRQLDSNKPVLVHCAWGRDRTGLVLAYYLAYDFEISASEAILRVRQVQPKAIMAVGWEEMTVRIFNRLLRS